MNAEIDTLPLARAAAGAIRTAVVGHLGRPESRVAAGRAPGGDVTMHIDELAEDALDTLLRAAGDIAYYSEDRGYVEYGRPRAVFVVDPIDGTRPAAAGLEAAVVSIAVAAPRVDATFADVVGGVVLELREGAELVATKGGGVQRDGVALPKRSETGPIELATTFWGASQRARPALAVAYVLAELIDVTAMHGGYFDLGSAAFTMSRIATGQLDAYVDPGHRMLVEVPALDPEFRRVGHGACGTNFPYDVADAKLIVEEIGGTVVSADGSSLADRPVVGSGDGFGVSLIAAASAARAEQLVEVVDRGMTALRDRFDPPCTAP